MEVTTDVSIPITETCSACGATLAELADRVACRACFDLQRPTPTLCRPCLERHRNAEHPSNGPGVTIVVDDPMDTARDTPERRHAVAVWWGALSSKYPPDRGTGGHDPCR